MHAHDARARHALAGATLLALAALPASATQSITPTVVVTAPATGQASSAGDWNGALPLEDQAASTSRLIIEPDTLTGADRIERLSAHIPGAIPSVSHAGFASALLVRGFALTRYHIDGLPDIQRMHVRDLETVEHIDVLRGPDAVMRGITDPGGVVEYVAKQPSFKASGRLTQQLGDHGHARSTIDLTGPIGAQWAYRLVASAREGDTHPGGLTEDRRVGLAALTWAYRRGGTLSFSTEEQRNRKAYVFGTVITDAGPQYDRLFAADHQRNDRRYRRTALLWQDALTERLTVTARYAESDVHRDETLIGFWSLLNNDTLRGYATRYRDRYHQQNWRLDARLDLDWHTLIIGRDDNRQRVDFTGTQNIGGFTVDVANPDFSTVNYDALTTTARLRRETHRDSSWFIGDRMRLADGLDLTIGARQMHYTLRSGATLAPAGDADSLSWHTGLVARPTHDLKLHMAVATGTAPNTGKTRDGDFLPAQRTRQTEAGARWQATPAMALGGAIYRITLDNLPMTDPLDRTARISAGRRRVTGIELSGEIRSGAWTLSGNGNWLTTRQLVSTANGLGDAFPGVPRFSAGVSVGYAASIAHVPVTAKLDAIHVGARHGDAANTFRIAGYQRFDVGLTSRIAGADWGLSVHNLLDTRHIAAISARDDVYQGERRRVVVSASIPF
ncbi:MAG: hypothetical protein DWQ11_11865 [Proteobacteria bacterium]|nr:MAG: hypothetical protein DWQ11_11865 [Pseudomonadota bacterium]